MDDVQKRPRATKHFCHPCGDGGREGVARCRRVEGCRVRSLTSPPYMQNGIGDPAQKLGFPVL